MPAKQHTMHGRDHLPQGADPIPGIPPLTGTDVEDIILGLPGLDAFWKLNETSGNVAHDSSGNGHDLTATGTYDPPVWGQPAGPPGDTSANFDPGLAGNTRVTGVLADFTDDFTAGIWINAHSNIAGEILGQGTGGIHVTVDGGWALYQASPLGVYKFAVVVDGNLLYANNPRDLDTWYFVAVVRDSGTWKLYVNGLLQAATITDSPGTSIGDNTWIGNDDFAGHSTYLQDADLSYGFIADSVLTSTELLNIYNAGLSGGTLDPGLVWTSNGTGGASWQQVDTTSLADEAVTVEKIEPGTDGYWLTTDAGTVVWAELPDATSDPSTDTLAWMPLTTVTGGVPELVWEATDELIPTLVGI